MGAGLCNCYGERRENWTEANMSLPETARINDMISLANKELSEYEMFPVKEEKCEYSFFSSPVKSPDKGHTRTPSKSTIYLGKRILEKHEYKSIDLGFFLSQDDMSTVNLTALSEGVACCPADIFELENGEIYKGEFDEDGFPHGRGIQIGSDGSKYIGYFFHGKIQGIGRLVNKDGVLLQGVFVYEEHSTTLGCNAVLDGLGKELWPNGIKYDGEFKMGVKDGRGKLTLKNCKYIGEFKDDQMDGEGTMMWKNGKKYSGQWKKGLMHGYGTFSWPSGKVYNGEYEKGVKNGNGVMKWKDGRKYEGVWQDGKQHGIGVYTFFDKKKERLRSGRSEWIEGNRTRWLSPMD